MFQGAKVSRVQDALTRPVGQHLVHLPHTRNFIPEAGEGLKLLPGTPRFGDRLRAVSCLNVQGSSSSRQPRRQLHDKIGTDGPFYFRQGFPV